MGSSRPSAEMPASTAGRPGPCPFRSRAFRLTFRGRPAALGLLAAGLLAVTASAVAAAEAASADAATPKAGASPVAIAGSRAGDYVGQEVTIEGRVAAVHESPLATVLAFAPNFAGFTATILAADRDKFPSDLMARVRDKVVRVSGTVMAYRGKPEMALREPAQLVLAASSGAAPANVATLPAPPPAADGSLEEIRRALLRIENRLESLEGRLGALEQDDTAPAEGAPEPRAPTLTVGAAAADVRTILGDPLQVGRGPNGETLWAYGRGRAVTFDTRGRVSAWTGF